MTRVELGDDPVNSQAVDLFVEPILDILLYLGMDRPKPSSYRKVVLKVSGPFLNAFMILE